MKGRENWTGRALLLGTLLGISTLLLGGCGGDPFIVLPGGALSGNVTDPPVDWTPYRDVDEIQLETRPDDPYSVNLWIALLGADAYIATGEDGTNWTSHIEAQPDVRLRIGESIYELTARSVTDPQERRAVLEEYVRKYEVDGDMDSWVQAGIIYRLDRR